MKGVVQPPMTTADRGCSEPASLLKLAKRCEREEPSQELNEEIAFSVGWRLKEVMWWKAPGSKDWVMGVPVFTTSLDAAVTLVPRGGIWSAHGCDAPGHKGFADVSTTFEPHYFKADASTPALALCAAALRARAHEAEPL